MDSLQNHFLIAMPALADGFFDRAVIYICEHDARGAMGLMINKPIGLDVNELLEQMGLEGDELRRIPALDAKVVVGGPVNPERGFVLHSPQPGWAGSTKLSDDIMLTTSRDVLTKVGTNEGPEHFIVALGYSGWSAGQLEQELADNSWLTIPANSALLFGAPHEDRWQQASRALGFEPWQISNQTGHA
ncbi:YqgE/AlgH family protein [Shewanella cyperi]|uniref:YqgE/AlgH family protein n=1 Tax=Shewanella cyperi TaxID=2814292 RepID=UPI001A941889|nr:YqgE/AlgH family protein [Shewanella cyperi]QSX41747.1 YqgE/AlgH family protein [Shewanella cyperi]